MLMSAGFMTHRRLWMNDFQKNLIRINRKSGHTRFRGQILLESILIGITVFVMFYFALPNTMESITLGTYTAITETIARMLEEYRKVHKEDGIEKTLEQLSKEKVHKEKPSQNGVIVKGIDNCLVKLSKCCNPVPGDEIIGYITRGRGVSVHRTDCVNTKNLLNESDRIIDVYWSDNKKTTYSVDIEIYANDRAGLLADIINVLGINKCKIMAVNSKATKEKIAMTELTVEVENIEQLNDVLKALRKIDSIYEVKRKKQ